MNNAKVIERLEAALLTTPEELAEKFHEFYEATAPEFGYKTREESAKPWAEVPEQNKGLMIAACAKIMLYLMGKVTGEDLMPDSRVLSPDEVAQEIFKNGTKVIYAIEKNVEDRGNTAS